MTSSSAPVPAEHRTPRRWLALVCALTVGVLALNLTPQIFDTNFYSLFEATSLLAGDHPYRDFFEWGIPLQAAASAGMQWITGNRMVGEFVLLHWPFIVAGAAISFSLAWRLTRSTVASIVLAVMALGMLPDTPTFHYPKLFLYPLGIWLAWRYLDAPGPRRAAALGCGIAVAFLFRHDHGLYLAVAAGLALTIARYATPATYPWRSLARAAAVTTATAALLVAPWAVLVQRSEGLVDYVRARATLYDMWSGRSPYHLLLSMNPLRLLAPADPAVPRPGIITFEWNRAVGETQRAELVQRLGLRFLDGPDERQRWRYAVDDADAPRMYELHDLVNDSEGIDWDRLARQYSWLPTLERARLWQEQVTLLVPLLLLASAGIDLLRARRRRAPVPPQTWRLLLAGAVLAVLDARLFREASYSHLVAPLTAAMATWFLTLRRPGVTTLSMLDYLRVGLTLVLLTVTAVTAAAFFRPERLLTAGNFRAQAQTFRNLLASPPIDAFARAGQIRDWTEGHDRESWERGDVQAWPQILLRYMHDCTTAGDHVLVSGQTPFQVNYLVGRPLAGGHLFWHHRWRTDPAREAVLLALVESQSIPFAFSTHDPVLSDLEAYPSIHQYFEQHYRPLPGANGLLLVDARRRSASTFGPYGFPCFK